MNQISAKSERVSQFYALLKNLKVIFEVKKM